MDYYEYIQSPEWQQVRKRALGYWGYKCAICCSTEALQVHHRTYEHLGQEHPTDVIVLCDECHELYSRKLPRWYGWLGRISSKIFDGVRW